MNIYYIRVPSGITRIFTSQEAAEKWAEGHSMRYRLHEVPPHDEESWDLSRGKFIKEIGRK